MLKEVSGNKFVVYRNNLGEDARRGGVTYLFLKLKTRAGPYNNKGLCMMSSVSINILGS